tara:strand:- start:1371 stop:2609 length:1239 start_codon:yes stop_codon:yes gene_type:complete
MGNEQSNNSHLHNDKEVDAFNKYMQQQIISQTAKQSNTKNTQLETTKNIQIYDKKTKKNISRQHKEIELEKEKLRKREEDLLKQEQLLNKKKEQLRKTYQQQTKRSQFNNFQQQREQEFKKEINDLKTIRVNPLKVFQLEENYTLEELKKAYRKLALKYHPDRPDGNELKFKIVTKIYLALFEDYKKKLPEKQYLDLRNSSRQFISQQNNNQKQNVHMDSERFNLKLFNKIYDENKLYSDNDNGYGKWLQDDNNIKTPPKPFSKSFNLNVFNTSFNDERANYAKGREIVEYKEPEAQGTSMNYGNIGEGKIKDFSSNHNSETHYSDLKKAYTDTFLVPTEEITRKKYEGINQLKNDRSNINFTMSETDKQRQALINERLEKEEMLRQQRVRQNDELIEKHFNKMNNLFLGFR